MYCENSFDSLTSVKKLLMYVAKQTVTTGFSGSRDLGKKPRGFLRNIYSFFLFLSFELNCNGKKVRRNLNCGLRLVKFIITCRQEVQYTTFPKNIERGIGVICKIRHYVNVKILVPLYHTIFLPFFHTVVSSGVTHMIILLTHSKECKRKESV